MGFVQHSFIEQTLEIHGWLPIRDVAVAKLLKLVTLGNLGLVRQRSQVLLDRCGPVTRLERVVRGHNDNL